MSMILAQNSTVKRIEGSNVKLPFLVDRMIPSALHIVALSPSRLAALEPHTGAKPSAVPAWQRQLPRQAPLNGAPRRNTKFRSENCGHAQNPARPIARPHHPNHRERRQLIHRSPFLDLTVRTDLRIYAEPIERLPNSNQRLTSDRRAVRTKQADIVG